MPVSKIFDEPLFPKCSAAKYRECGEAFDSFDGAKDDFFEKIRTIQIIFMK